jgi:hypothetical protein
MSYSLILCIFFIFCLCCVKRAEVQRSIGSFSVRKHANLTANLTVQGQHVSNVCIEAYIRAYTSLKFYKIMAVPVHLCGSETWT